MGGEGGLQTYSLKTYKTSVTMATMHTMCSNCQLQAAADQVCELSEHVLMKLNPNKTETRK